MDETFGILFGSASPSFLVTGIIVGFLVILLVLRPSPILSRAIACSFSRRQFSIIDFILLRVLDDKFRNLDFLPTS
jgi:hypothetical protein